MELVPLAKKYGSYFIIFIALAGAGSQLWDYVNRVPYIHIKYRGFDLLMDCKTRSALFVHYILKADNGSYNRSSDFFMDSTIPAYCRQTSSRYYPMDKLGQKYDRGHLVPANHLDGDALSIRQSNFMTNILPQAAELNRGAWYETEELAECLRDEYAIEIWAGPVWGTHPNSSVKNSHGINVPAGFWKVMIADGGAKQIAWIFPNNGSTKGRTHIHYVSTIKEVEKVLGTNFPFPSSYKNLIEPEQWKSPANCNKG